MEKNIIGIDISKKYFDAVLNGGVQRFDNDRKGICKFIKKITLGSHCAMESTGNYGYNLVYAIQKAESFAYVINPLKIKQFSRMKLSKTKTDALDAHLITNYATLVFADLHPYEFTSENLEEGKQILTLLEQLKKSRTALINHLESINPLPLKSQDAIESANTVIAELNVQIKALEEKVSKLVRVDFSDMLDNIKSIKGVGEASAILVVAKTNGFKGFENYKQVSSFFGCCPRIIESGSSVRGKQSISKIGHAVVRTQLYMCAVSAKRCNKSCKELYDRLIKNNRPPKVALLAVVNKLIRQIFAIAKSGKKYSNLAYN